MTEEILKNEIDKDDFEMYAERKVDEFVRDIKVIISTYSDSTLVMTEDECEILNKRLVLIYKTERDYALEMALKMQTKEKLKPFPVYNFEDDLTNLKKL